MPRLSEFVDFVNQQMDFHERRSEDFKDEPGRQEFHSRIANKFRALAATIEETERQLEKMSSPPSPSKSATSLSWGEIEGLPNELMDELNISESDKSEFNLIALIEELGGVASLDRLLVEIYKKTETVTKRTNLNARLYRMVQKELIYSIPGKKGVYSTTPTNNED